MKTTPFTTTMPLPGVDDPIVINGQAYDYGGLLFPDDTPEDQYDYDLDTILYKGTDIIDLLTAQYGGPKEWDALHDAVMACVVKQVKE